MKKNETYYDILKVHPRTSITEVVNAYHAARAAFSKDSLATYSLFSPEENEAEIKKLEEAFVTLSNVDRKREYDKKLEAGTQGTPTTLPSSSAGVVTPEAKPAPATVASASVSKVGSEIASAPGANTGGPVMDGAFLKSTREQKGMTLEDVARLTKLPLRALKAIESDDVKNLPARVYLHGFVNNLVKLYRADAAIAKGYIQYVDGLRTTKPNL